MAKAKLVAYGVLGLRPWEFDELSVMDFNEMVDGHNQKAMADKWVMAYWTANIMNVSIKHPVSPSELMRPFTKNTGVSRAKDAEAFFTEFAAQREEAEREKG